jgi:hypothetical protein
LVRVLYYPDNKPILQPEHIRGLPLQALLGFVWFALEVAVVVALDRRLGQAVVVVAWGGKITYQLPLGSRTL